jgi:glycosyltransferase involved in cell wall biosynthesis
VRIVVAHSHLNTLGGGERVTLELLRRLSRRHDVTLWAGGYHPEHTYTGLAAFPRRDLAVWEWLMARPDADAVITHTFGANLLALRHPATLWYIHTLRSVYLRRAHRLDLRARRALERAALHHAAGIATNSHYTADRFAARYGRAAAVVPCGVEERLFDLPQTPGADALYVGRLAPEKGIERLLTWSAELPIDLAIAGTGAPGYVAFLRGLAGPRTRWLGPLREDALTRAYAACRCLVFLPYEEEFGLAALEAMAAARPIIATPEGGLPELVTDGVTGYLVRDRAAFATAVLRLRDDTALAARLGLAGRARARGFTWDAMADRLEALCRDAVARRPR